MKPSGVLRGALSEEESWGLMGAAAVPRFVRRGCRGSTLSEEQLRAKKIFEV